MQGALTPALQRVVNDSVESGRYDTLNQVVREALRVDRQKRPLRVARPGSRFSGVKGPPRPTTS